MKKLKKQVKIKNNDYSNAKIVNLGSAIILTLGSRGGDCEGRNRPYGIYK